MVSEHFVFGVSPDSCNPYWLDSNNRDDQHLRLFESIISIGIILAITLYLKCNIWAIRRNLLSYSDMMDQSNHAVSLRNGSFFALNNHGDSFYSSPKLQAQWVEDDSPFMPNDESMHGATATITRQKSEPSANESSVFVLGSEPPSNSNSSDGKIRTTAVTMAVDSPDESERRTGDSSTALPPTPEAPLQSSAAQKNEDRVLSLDSQLIRQSTDPGPLKGIASSSSSQVVQTAASTIRTRMGHTLSLGSKQPILRSPQHQKQRSKPSSGFGFGTPDTSSLRKIGSRKTFRPRSQTMKTGGIYDQGYHSPSAEVVLKGAIEHHRESVSHTGSIGQQPWNSRYSVSEHWNHPGNSPFLYGSPLYQTFATNSPTVTPVFGTAAANAASYYAADINDRAMSLEEERIRVKRSRKLVRRRTKKASSKRPIILPVLRYFVWIYLGLVMMRVTLSILAANNVGRWFEFESDLFVIIIAGFLIPFLDCLLWLSLCFLLIQRSSSKKAYYLCFRYSVPTSLILSGLFCYAAQFKHGTYQYTSDDGNGRHYRGIVKAWNIPSILILLYYSLRIVIFLSVVFYVASFKRVYFGCLYQGRSHPKNHGKWFSRWKRMAAARFLSLYLLISNVCFFGSSVSMCLSVRRSIRRMKDGQSINASESSEFDSNDLLFVCWFSIVECVSTFTEPLVLFITLLLDSQYWRNIRNRIITHSSQSSSSYWNYNNNEIDNDDWDGADEAKERSMGKGRRNNNKRRRKKSTMPIYISNAKELADFISSTTSDWNNSGVVSTELFYTDDIRQLARLADQTIIRKTSGMSTDHTSSMMTTDNSEENETYHKHDSITNDDDGKYSGRFGFMKYYWKSRFRPFSSSSKRSANDRREKMNEMKKHDFHSRKKGKKYLDDSRDAGARYFDAMMEDGEKRVRSSRNRNSGMRIPILDFADLEFKKAIGKGATAKVYRCNYKGRECAAKDLTDTNSAIYEDISEELIYKFCREALIFSHVRHPNIIQFVGVCLEPPYFYLVTELATHGTLRNVLDASKMNRLKKKQSLQSSVHMSVLDGITERLKRTNKKLEQESKKSRLLASEEDDDDCDDQELMVGSHTTMTKDEDELHSAGLQSSLVSDLLSTLSSKIFSTAKDESSMALDADGSGASILSDEDLTSIGQSKKKKKKKTRKKRKDESALENVLLDWSDRIMLALDISRGMQLIHAMNIIHRDLNTNNILICYESPRIAPQKKKSGGTRMMKKKEKKKKKRWKERRMKLGITDGVSWMKRRRKSMKSVSRSGKKNEESDDVHSKESNDLTLEVSDEDDDEECDMHSDVDSEEDDEDEDENKESDDEMANQLYRRPRLVAKICDFGLARRIEDPYHTAKVNRTWTLAGAEARISKAKSVPSKKIGRRLGAAVADDDDHHYTDVLHSDSDSERSDMSVDETSEMSLESNSASEFCQRYDIDTSDLRLTVEVGTVPYLAPELLKQLRIGKNLAAPLKPSTIYTNSVDVFAFGIVLWELLTEDVPYSELKSLKQIQDRVLMKGRLVIPDGIQGALKSLIEQCWAHTPIHRPSFDMIVLKLAQQIISSGLVRQVGHS